MAQLPEFDTLRSLLAGSNGKTRDTAQAKLIDSHYRHYVTKTLTWSLEDWDHPSKADFKATVKAVIEYWQSSSS